MDEPSSRKAAWQESDLNSLLDVASNLDSALSKEQWSKVTNLLTQVSELSDLEKLMLYLKLPTGVTEEPAKNPQTSMSERTLAAIKWIRSHYVEDENVCLLKQDVFEEYRQKCVAAGNTPISSCDFAKMMKFVFPKVYQRRLGKRGCSKYYYGGLKSKNNSGSACQTEKPTTSPDKEDEDVNALSCQLVCEWASQLFDRQFLDIQNLSDYLVSKGVSCGRAATKFTQVSGNIDLADQGRKSPSSRHQDAQLFVQRKLQNNEVIREQKQRLAQKQKLQKEQAEKRFVVYQRMGDQTGTAMVSVVPRGRSQPCLSLQRSASKNKPSPAAESGVNLDGTSLPHSLIMPLHKPSYTIATVSVDAETTRSLKPPTNVRERGSGSSQIKRCQSTSVVEKHSMHLTYNSSDSLGQVSDQLLSATDCHDISDKYLPQQPHPVKPMEVNTPLSELKHNPKLSSSLSLPPVSNTACNLTKLLESPSSQKSMSSLITPQHPKRNGDSISPDRGSYTKRRCITSLGVTKQQSLDVDMAGGKFFEDEASRTRPYSCPISVDESQYDSGIERGDSLLNPLSIGTKSSEIGCRESMKSIDEQNYSKTSRFIVASTACKGKETDSVKSAESQQKKTPNLVHFVKKPTVISRPVSLVNSSTSCQDLKEAEPTCDDKQSETKTSRSSSRILNSLLSSSCDILPDSGKISESVSVTQTLPRRGSDPRKEQSQSIVQKSPLRQVTNSPHSVESSGILSSLSSRSAFVPVTSNKSMVASIRKDPDNVINAPSIHVPSPSQNKDPVTSVHQDKDQSTPATFQSVHQDENTFPRNSSKGVSGFSSVRPVKHNILNTLSSSSSSSSSTLCRSGESTSSSGESSFATPVPISLTEKSDGSLKSVPEIPAMTEAVTLAPSTTQAQITVPQSKSSPVKRCITPVHVSQPSNQTVHMPQTRTITTSPITQPKRASRNRFAPIRPKLGNGTNTPSPQKLGGSTTPSPQKADMRPISAILKEQRVKNAQDLLVNLANNYQGEVKLQMPAELLGLSPSRKSKSTDVLVTIGPSNNTVQKNLQMGKSEVYPKAWPVIAAPSPQKEITVVVEPVSQVSSQPPTSQVSSLGSMPQLPLQLVTNNVCSVAPLPQSLFSPNTTFQSQPQHVPLAVASTGSDGQIIILPPAVSGQTVVQNAGRNVGQPILVEDNKGNMYSLDKKSGSMISPQDLQKLLGNNQTGTTPNTKQSHSTMSPGLLNISEIKGHVVGPDANGQTYLLVPNSESDVLTSSTPAFSFVPQQTTSALTTSITSSATNPVVVSAAAGIIQPRATSSSALLTELSQLVSTGQQKVSAHGLIQHNFGSAFHKCSSSGHKKEEATHKTTGFVTHDQGNIDEKQYSDVSSNPELHNKTLPPYVIETEQPSQKCSQTKNQDVSAGVTKPHGLVEAVDIHKGQGPRKRKASKSAGDEREDKKRISSSKDRKEMDDDVYIVNVEGTCATDTGEKSLCMSDNKPKTQLQTNTSSFESGKSDPVTNLNQNETPQPTLSHDATDTETLLSIIEDSKTMTVKEAVQVLNAVQARQNKENQRSQNKSKIRESAPEDKHKLEMNFSCDLVLGSQSDTNVSPCDTNPCRNRRRANSDHKLIQKPPSIRCNSVSPNVMDGASLQTVNQKAGCSTGKGPVKVQRTGKRHISLNLESLESDALLDIEPALDQRLVVDSRDTQMGQSDCKTSVGVAAKTAKNTNSGSSSDNTKESKCSQKQMKQPTISNRALRAYQMLLDKKQLDKICSRVPCSEQTSGPVGNSGTGQDTFVSAGGGRQDEKLCQLTSKNEGKLRQKHPSAVPRSISCVRDILRSQIDLGKADFSQGKPGRGSDPITKSFQRSKTSDHPYLTRQLQTTKLGERILHTTNTDSYSSTRKIYDENTIPSLLPNKEEIASSKVRSTDTELPGDIVDFITESMSSRHSYQSNSCMDDPLSSLLADLARNGQESRTPASSLKEQNSIVWRSMSVPNTIPDNHDFYEKNTPQNNEWFVKEVHDHSLTTYRSHSTCGFQTGLLSSDGVSKQRFVPHSGHKILPGNERQLSGHESTEIIIQKDPTVENTSQSSDIANLTPATFLSPLGPARLARRPSVERSVLADRSSAKTPIELAGNKCPAERPPSRMKTPVDRSQSKTPVDRAHRLTPVDRSSSKVSVDRSGQKTSGDRSPNLADAPYIKDPTTAAVLQQPVKDREQQKLVAKRMLTHSPADKLSCHTVPEKQLLQSLHHQSSLDSSKSDRSLSQTPVSDGGYNSVSQTPVSDIGYSSVSPSPIMMSTSGMFGECGHRDLTSPGTMFMPLRSDSVLSVMHSGRSNDGIDSTGNPGRPNPLHCGLTSVYSILSSNPNFYSDNLNNGNRNKPEGAEYDVGPGESSLFQDAVDGTLFHSSFEKDKIDYDIIRASGNDEFADTSSLLDLEKLMSAQLTCIPTPPSSPSSSPQHSSEPIQSPVQFSSLNPLSSHSTEMFTAYSGLTSPFSSVTVTTVSFVTAVSNNRSQITSTSPARTGSGYNSPVIPSNSSVSPLSTNHPFSSPHQYNPHPSPPFTPSSQLCLSSPRCPTPCSHRSLMSPRCATPCGDSNSAPNRFMPIQTSGILATPSASTQAYIQPIKPVVTVASLASQNSHLTPVFSRPDHIFTSGMASYKSNQTNTDIAAIVPDFQNTTTQGHFLPKVSSFVKAVASHTNSTQASDGLQQNQTIQINAEENTPQSAGSLKIQQNKGKDVRATRSTQPALILSLTGSIGTVSRQGMKSGWSKELASLSPSSSSLQKYDQHQSSTTLSQNHTSSITHSSQGNHASVSSEILPTYEEAMSLLTGQSSDLGQNEEPPPPVTVNMRQEISEMDSNQRQDYFHTGLGDCESLQTSDVTDENINVRSNHQQVHSDKNEELVSGNMNTKSSLLMKQGSQAVASNRNRASTLQNTTEYPFSHHLAQLSNRSRSSNVSQSNLSAPSKHHACDSSQPSFLSSDTTDSQITNRLHLSSMFSVPSFDCGQSEDPAGMNACPQPITSKPLQPTSGLPTAYYAGTAPNVDLAKTPILTPRRNVTMTHNETKQTRRGQVDQSVANFQEQVMTFTPSQLDKTLAHSSPGPDVLEETLDVLKSLDSQYFQPDDDTNSYSLDALNYD